MSIVVPAVTARPGDPEITPALVKEHGLSPDEYQRVLDIMGRTPSYTELGVFSVMWSEHCSYKTSRIHLKTLPTEGPRVLQGPGENAGVIDIGDGLAIAFKMESHNHPSFIEPFQGAATGVGGILRDVFTMGARPIAILNSLRFGAADHEKTKYLLPGVVAGIAAYGNCVGVPTVAGEVNFHPSYNGNILVNAMAVGLLPSDGIFRGVAAGPGNPVLYVGARTGRDGIHGATMASDTFEEGVEKPRPTVQVGDPYTEKLLIEACLELMREDAIVAIQDMGAAGLTSSSVEMAGRGGTGLLMDVSRIPAAAEGMTPYEFLLSESQERMLIVAAKGKEHIVERVFAKWDLEAVVMGEVTDDGLWRVTEGDREVVAIPVTALTDAAPVYNRPYAEPEGFQASLTEPELTAHGDAKAVLLALLASPNIADKRWIYRQYDHMVRLGTTLRPGAADAAVVRIPGTTKAVALTTDCNSVWVKADPFVGTEGAIAEAARNVACTGAEPLAITDCLNFGNPERPEVMWEFVRSIEGMNHALRELAIPVVSGNVSLYNETSQVSVHPTPGIGLVGLLEDRSCAVGLGFTEAGHRVVLLGTPRPTFGASAYGTVMHGVERGAPPAVHWAEERALLGTLREGIEGRHILSAHDAADGGLGVALAEMALAGGRAGSIGSGLGATVQLPVSADLLARERWLFGETHGCAWVEVADEHLAELAGIAGRHGCAMTELGRVGGTDLRVTDQDGAVVLDAPVSALRDAWEGGLVSAVGLTPAPPRP